MIQRTLFHTIKQNLFKGKAILIFGPRQVGKTTLLNMLSENLEKKVLYMDCDEPDIRKDLTDVTSDQLKSRIGDAEVVMIDEAQRVKNMGITLKLIKDKIENVQLIVTGSSALELSNEIGEPLTGRKYEFLLLPMSTYELINHSDSNTEKRLLENRILYGMYPDVINNPGNEIKILYNLVGSYLYKDIYTFQDIRKPEIIELLLEALALQIGSEVSYHELSKTIGVDQLTIRRYIDLLEKAYVIFRLRAFSRNVRNEIKKSRKIYFYDNGVRNAILSSFNKLELRTDKGALWENFLMNERLKFLNNSYKFVNRYFWRTTQQQEIDYIEDRDDKINAFEFKWRSNKKIKIPKTFSNAYPNAIIKTITPENYLEFLQ
ncbi:MAG: ATP-binding protein [Bacteroidales bacterium]|nr:ATP-binding protein [Bacteroidales bacterium]